jgi:pimeloyl-ACP methyl ester carboxylesterase
MGKPIRRKSNKQGRGTLPSLKHETALDGIRADLDGARAAVMLPDCLGVFQAVRDALRVVEVGNTSSRRLRPDGSDGGVPPMQNAERTTSRKRKRRILCRRLRFRLVVHCALLLASCASIRVDHVHQPALLDAWRASAVLRDELSPRSLQTLRQWDLAQLYSDKPDEAIAKLYAVVLRDPQPELVFTLAEMNYVGGRKAEKHDCARATAYYYLCAGYAYHYLFDEPPRPAPDMETSRRTSAPSGDTPDPPPLTPVVPRSSIFDPRFRLACDLYNAGLAKLIAAAQRVGQLDPRHQLRMPTPDGQGFTLSVLHEGFTWKPEEFGKLLVCSDWSVVGLANQHRTYGLGVPLIATRNLGGSKEDAARAFYPHEACFAATAFFRFEGTLADLGTLRCGRMELKNPLTIQAVDVAGQTVPLETDLTTPLAYFLEHSDMTELNDYLGFLRGDLIRSQTGMRMLAPYQPGKIPVVLIHGLLSSPLTWAPVINDLQADPVLRERYQFWYYYYPTAAPYLSTAAQLRYELDKLRNEVDPQHKDPALDNMVFVGHSMGGLIANLMTIDSGEDFWKIVSNEPFDKLKLPADARAELEQTFFFQRQSCVKRVIFIATPHRGSKLSPSPLGRLAVHLVQMPSEIRTIHSDLIKDNPGLAKVMRERALPTSIDLLAPDAPALKLMVHRPRPDNVHYHTIYGDIKAASTKLEFWLVGGSDDGDGVVPFSSAHIVNADSEVKVRADHFHVHHHPLAIQEVRRILTEHYQQYIRQQGPGKEFQLMASDTQKHAATVHPQTDQPQNK